MTDDMFHGAARRRLGASNRIVLVTAVACSLATAAVAEPGDVRIHVDKIEGSVDEVDDISETIDRPGSYRRCFPEDMLADSVTVTVNVRENGNRGAVAFTGSPPRSARACIQRVVRRLRFRRQPHPRSVTFTLTVEREPVPRVLLVVDEDEFRRVFGGTDLSLATAAPSPAPPTSPVPPFVTVVGGESVSGPDVVNEAVAKIRAAYVAGMKRCYRDALARSPGLKAAIELTIEIEDTGRARIESVSGVDDEALAACLAMRGDGWRFKMPTAPATVRVRLQLDPE